MSDETGTDLREQVRTRYAAAARAVLEPAAGVAASCCGSSATESCCGAGPSAAEAVGGFSENLYREGETDGLPEADALKIELEIGFPIFTTEDSREGTKAFAEKRKPEFKGT